MILSEFGFDQTVGFVVPFVNNIDFVGLAVAEYIEIMTEQIHLYTCFFGIHRFYCELLDAVDLDAFIIDITFG